MRSYTAAVPEPTQRLDWRERWFGDETGARLWVAARRHWVFLVVLAAGVLLRVVTQIAYRPALLYIDSYRYLGNLHDLDPAQTSQPLGYVLLLLRPVLAAANLAVVAAVHHLIGLGMGVAIYALVVRLGARRRVVRACGDGPGGRRRPRRPGRLVRAGRRDRRPATDHPRRDDRSGVRGRRRDVRGLLLDQGG